MVTLVNRAKMTTATTGTGTITLGSAVDGYQTFAAAGVADADVVRYVIEDGNNWEIGKGTYTASGTLLGRAAILESSNSDAAINLTGSAVVFVSAVAEDISAAYVNPAREVFTATAAQTTFATNGYTVGYLDVYLNGVLLVNGTDYTATNGTDVVLSSGATSGDTLTVIVFGEFSNGTVVTTDGAQTLSNKTTEALILNDGYTEEVFAVTGTTPALSPTNGSIQTWTLSGNSTPTAGTWAAGQSITLMVDDGTAYTIDWASVSVTWKSDGGTAPTLNTSGDTAIALWKVGTTIYGARVGDA